MPDPSPGSHTALALAWVEGRLDPAKRDQFEAHLDGCAECQGEVARALQNSRKMKALNFQEAERQAAERQKRPVTSIKPEVKVAPPTPAKTPIAWWWWLIAAALIVLIGGFVLGWWTWLLAHS